MKVKILYALWGCMYILCVGLGLVPDATGFGKLLLVLTALIFFLPPAAILLHGLESKNPKTLRRLAIICGSSLLLTLCLLVANFLSLAMSAQAGKVLNELLLLVSAPMFCAQYWALSLFLWACLLFAAIFGCKRCVNNP